MQKKNPLVADSIAKEALELLTAYSWPGNVRELENVIHRSAVLAQGKAILVTDLPHELLEFSETRQEPESTKELVGAVVKELEGAEAISSSPEELSLRLYEHLKQSEPKGGILKVLESDMIQWALADCKGVHSKAAKRLGLTPATLRKRIRDYGIHFEA